MKNTLGNLITVTLFGESRGEAVGCVLDGIAPGIPVDARAIERAMDQRRAFGMLDTERREADEVRFLSGVKEGFTEGTPICILIENTDRKAVEKNLFRPGHADFAQYEKYHGFADLAGGGHASGRLTAPIVAAGAILRAVLAEKGIRIGTHISALHGVADAAFSDFAADLDKLDSPCFPVLSEDAGERMKKEILAAKAEKDSVGGILETAVFGLPSGIGEPFFDSLESTLSHALFSMPGVKGIEFGDGFAFANAYGSESNDALIKSDGKPVTKTNHNGGVSGGISTGAPILFRCAIRPTASIGKEQTSYSPETGRDEVLASDGRNDPCILPRARAVADALTALAVADALSARFGCEYFAGKRR